MFEDIRVVGELRGTFGRVVKSGGGEVVVGETKDESRGCRPNNSVRKVEDCDDEHASPRQDIIRRGKLWVPR